VSKVELFYEDTQTLKLPKSTLKKYINLLISGELKKVGEISVILCSDKYLLEINIEYLKHNYYTDIITFNYVEGNLISGDLFISVDRVKENSIVFNTGLIKELYRVIFHGILHLIGYNDKTEEEKKIMKTKEDLYLDEVDFSEIEI
jgi:probable rRNA maturation factor